MNRESGFRVSETNCMEDWMSGLNQQFTKLSAAKVAREFESHIFRPYKIPPLMAVILLGGR